MDWVAVAILLISGISLIIAELFLPGGIIGGIGAILSIIGIGVAIYINPTMAAYLAILMMAFFGLAIYYFIKVMPNTRYAGSIFLHHKEDTHTGYRSSDSKLETLVGKEGVAVSDLRPSGVADIEDERVDVVTDGGYINSGTPIKVIEVEGNRVVVDATGPAPDSDL
jgi:membrane-bound serine protease (ClpP class)